MHICECISKGLQVKDSNSRVDARVFTKGQKSLKALDGAMVLILCTLSDDAFYLYQVAKLSQRFSQLLSRCDLHTEIYRRA